MSNEIKDPSKPPETTIRTPRPSSPREFFARIYGHLEEPKEHGGAVGGNGSESGSDVEVGSDGGSASPMWPPPLPLCPRPLLLPHQQLAFGAGLAAFLARRRRKESRPRRQRTTFSAHQTLRLELEYARGEYVARARRYVALTKGQNSVECYSSLSVLGGKKGNGFLIAHRGLLTSRYPFSKRFLLRRAEKRIGMLYPVLIVFKLWNQVSPAVFPGFPVNMNFPILRLAMHFQPLWYCRCPWVMLTACHRAI
ncbi:uncharacterized protein LOC133515946 isoform X1 [Cydia pomonella]|uniref:uncharacterized protein LOC133515946 isoform X1 n=1 Tax=Cydia pomonella TaxID=82600 RepID=UPI002ADD9B13|nr:uncharacterized protein LOC133515946 isoform X1 [Cydia pomonella]